MSVRRRDKRTLRFAAAAAGAVVATTLATGPVSAASTAPDATREASPTTYTAGRYIVTFAGEPAATYTGGVAGIPRTAPSKGAQLNAADSSVRRYTAHLSATKRAALKKVGATASREYSLVLNGVAANLTAEQAKSLAKDPAVVNVAKDEMFQLQTNDSPEFLGIARLWRDLGGQDSAGSGVTVGVIDTGIWPESESFSPNTTPIPSSFVGPCQTGQEFDISHCNGKIVGARYYVDGFGQENIADHEFLSPRDGDGHGSHTASTAAGNRVSDVTVDDTNFGEISGMAPGAKIAAYKVCWAGKPGVRADGCAGSDLVAAIDDSVRDGVDVINYSIGGGSESPVTGPAEIAFLNAAAAGIFVAASAGNSGPGASTLDHPSPWVTTVAASTHRVSEKALELGDGRRFVGASTTPDLPALTPMALAADSAAQGKTADQAKLCLPDSLDPTKVAGKLVVCERGVNARVEKSLTVRKAGGAGMVLINPTPSSINGDLHYLPSIHLPNTALAPVTDYVKSGNATGKIVALRKGESNTTAPEVVDFSSRGPSTTTGGDILKPDLAAPGVDILAAVTPPQHEGRNYDMKAGTSMSAPHVAGLAALLIQKYPGWTPMAVKSALMTTARDHVSTKNPFDQGAGFVRPTLATDPGVVFDHGMRDWIGYLKGVKALPTTSYPTIPAIDGSDLNNPSIAIGDLVASQTVTRTLTSVSSKSESYRFSANVPGVQVTATPSQFVLRPGQSRTVRILMRRTTAPVDRWATGSVVFSSASGANAAVGDAVPKNGHIAELPVAVRPRAVAVDQTSVTGAAPAGSAKVTVSPGVSGTLKSTTAGLVGVTPEADTLATGDFDNAAPAPSAAADQRVVEVPAGTAVARFDTTVTDKASDLDLFVYRVVDGSPRLVGASATGTGDEAVTLHNPPAGTYHVYSHGYDMKSGGDYSFRGWVVPNTAAGNLTVNPASTPVTAGNPVAVTATWSGLDPAKDWFGALLFAVGDNTTRSTVLIQ